MRTYQLLTITMFGFLTCILMESTLAYITRTFETINGNCKCGYIIQKDKVDQKGNWNSSLTVDKHYKALNGEKISCIKITHLETFKNMVETIFVSGGISKSYVMLKFRSKGYGIHKNIEIRAGGCGYHPPRHPHSGASVAQGATSFLLFACVTFLYLYQLSKPQIL